MTEENGGQGRDAPAIYAEVCRAVPQLPRLLGLEPAAVTDWPDIDAGIAASTLEAVIAQEELGRGGLPMSHGQGSLVAALLARAGHAHLAHRVRPNFWEALESLDAPNRRLVLRILGAG